jgi:hypothetical protein
MTVLYPSFRFTTTPVFDLFYALSVCTPFRSWLAGISGMLMSKGKGISRFAFIVLWEYHWEPESLLFRRYLRLSDPLLILFVVILLHITAWLTFWILQ